ncbi:phage tail sheath family protein [Janthinobacterium sp. RB2R34]|uniref:phage tail sheath family protein n=1 Tax=Janthinobacterium sp. RB2R34 TaxID=3424193 RepID=UPI003F256A9B
MQLKTPGAYVVADDTVPDSLLGAATGMTLFLGYTEKPGQHTAAGPVLVGSIRQFEQQFGGPHAPQFSLHVEQGTLELLPTHNDQARFFLYHGLQSYFDNGGGPAFVQSTGTHADAIARGKRKEDFLDQLVALENVAGVSLIVAPDATLMDSSDACYAVWQALLDHCGAMRDRMVLVDVYGGGQPRTRHPQDDIISGSRHGLRASLHGSFLGFGAAYYPWLHFNLVDPPTITWDNLDDAALALLSEALLHALAGQSPAAAPAATETLALLFRSVAHRLPADLDNRAAQVIDTHRKLIDASPLYYRLAALLLALANQLPPGPAMAGVYARTDAQHGVWQAPANTGIVGAVAAAEEISQQDHEGLNLPPDGKAINAIRTFAGGGLLIWGARTLDGNSGDWRYVPVRRTAIMLEKTIKAAMAAHAFMPNDALRSTITAFLTVQWQHGALLGASAGDAFRVEVGTGSTMTADGIVQGTLRVSVAVALSHPAEFIQLSFEQPMQSS